MDEDGAKRNRYQRIIFTGKCAFSASINTRRILWDDGSTIIYKANTLEYIGGSPLIPDLIPSQSDRVLHNGMKPSHGLTVPPTPVVNIPVSPAIAYPSNSFTAEFFPAATIPVGNRGVGGLGIFLAAVKKKHERCRSYIK